MSTYRFIQDVYIDRLYPAGTSAATGDVSATATIPNTLPVAWVPNSAACEPLDTPALNAFYAAPIHLPGLTRAQFSTQAVAPPVTYWKATVSPTSQTVAYSLTGLGVNLAAINQ
jgi:hypothetical protein